MSPTGDERRGQHRVMRVVLFFVALVSDHLQGLSLNRFLAILFGIAATHGRLVDDVPLTAADNVLATIAGSLAFGPKVFSMFLTRKADDKV